MNHMQLVALMASILHSATYTPENGYIEKVENSIAVAMHIFTLVSEKRL